jgi:hypothetical protein
LYPYVVTPQRAITLQCVDNGQFVVIRKRVIAAKAAIAPFGMPDSGDSQCALTLRKRQASATWALRTHRANQKSVDVTSPRFVRDAANGPKD